MKSFPLVSIIMPVFNTQDYLSEAIESVLSQSYRNLELICIDDGSSDDSYRIMEFYSKQDPRVRIYRNFENLGVSKTANFGISKSKGKYISRFDSDDIMPKSRVESQVNFLEENPDTVVVGGQVVMISDDGEIIGVKKFPVSHKEIYEGMFNFMTLQQGAMMVNSYKLPNGFVWYKDDQKTAEEVDLFYRLFKYGKFANLESVALYYRIREGSTSLSDPKRTFFNTLNTRRKAVKFYGYKPTLKGRLINLSQFLVVSLLPSQVIYPVFSLVRGIRKANSGTRPRNKNVAGQASNSCKNPAKIAVDAL